MKRILKTLFLGIYGISAFAADIPSSFQYEFERAVPEGFSFHDLDGNIPSPDLTDYDFEVGVAWVRHYVAAEDNYVMASTSWYEPAGKSDDWMVLPPLAVESSDMILSWRAKSNNKSLRDGYSVYASEKGGNPSDFDLSSPLFRVDREENVWTSHNVSLASYEGKTIYLAFVNDSEDCSVLWIDGISADTPKNAAISLSTPLLIRPDETLRLTGNIRSTTDVPLGAFTLGWSIGEKEGSMSFDASDAPGGVFDMDIDTGISLNQGEDSELVVWAESDGVRNTVTSPIFPRYKRILAEEGTGTWCSYCIRGIVYSELLRKNYPESSVVIAYHSDVMGVEYFIGKIGRFMDTSALPAACCNRDKRNACDPGDFLNMYRKLQNERFKASLELTVSDNGDGSLEAESSVIFADNLREADFRIAYQIIENDVHVPGDRRYDQKNGYAGGENGPMGGFEDKPSVIPSDEMYYQEVARGEICDFDGVAGSVPSDIDKGVTYTHTYDFRLPEDVLVPANCTLVAILLDKDGKAVNCAQTPLAEYFSSVQAISNGIESEPVAFYSTDGRCLETFEKGINIVKYTDGSVRKVIVR